MTAPATTTKTNEQDKNRSIIAKNSFDLAAAAAVATNGKKDEDEDESQQQAQDQQKPQAQITNNKNYNVSNVDPILLMSVAKLKETLKAHGLKIGGGKKKEMQDRLRAYLDMFLLQGNRIYQQQHQQQKQQHQISGENGHELLSTTRTTTIIQQENDQGNKNITTFKVLEWDAAAMQYARLSYEGQASITWLDNNNNNNGGDGGQAWRDMIRATPMLATVDRRSRLQRKRPHACSATTWIALGHSVHFKFHRLHPPSDEQIEPTCAVCFQWANHWVAQEQIIYLARSLDPASQSSVYRPYDLGTEDTTVCVTGQATFSERQRWRSAYWHMSRNERYAKQGKQEDERDSAHGFAWSVWCNLPLVLTPPPNPGSNLTHHLTSCQNLHPSQWTPELQRVYLTTSFTLETRVKMGGGARFRVDSTWPWRALVLDEQHYDAPPQLPLPRRHEGGRSESGSNDLQLLWAEGPLWQRQPFDNKLRWNMSFASTLQRSVPSGIGARFLLSILQQATIAPGSTRLLGVVDSHALPTYTALQALLATPVQNWLSWCDGVDDDDKATAQHQKQGQQSLDPLTLVYMKQCLTKPRRAIGRLAATASLSDAVTLGELLEQRRIRIRVIPFPIRPSLFGTVRQMGQHAFSAWLGLRFSPEYHAIMYLDADAIPVINPGKHGFWQTSTQQSKSSSRTLQDLIYRRMFAPKNPCVNQRLEALEYAVLKSSPGLAVKPELACTNQLLTDSEELERTKLYCTSFDGHVVARCDALGMLYIHENYAKPWLDDMPPNTRFCHPSLNQTEKTAQSHLFPTDQLVEVHLRTKGRSGHGDRCACLLRNGNGNVADHVSELEMDMTIPKVGSHIQEKKGTSPKEKKEKVNKPKKRSLPAKATEQKKKEVPKRTGARDSLPLANN